MIDTEALTEEERDLRSGLLGAAGSAQLGGSGRRALHPPTPHAVLAAGRRASARRRAGGVAVLTAAALSVAAAGAGVGTGAFTLPWLRADGEARPGTLYASVGTRVGDVVNALDPHFFGIAPVGGGLSSWYYRTGHAASQRPGMVSKADMDRRIDLQLSDETAPAEFTFTLTKLAKGGEPETRTSTLATLSTGDDGRGQWRRVQASAEDGWLVLAVLPTGASTVQFRVTGTDVLLPVSDQEVEEGVVCYSTSDNPDGGYECAGRVTPPTVQFRLATTDPAPPIDAITYISKDGRFVTLGPEALVP